MGLKEETSCIATPGFAGFVPTLKYQYGVTYGNATRQIQKEVLHPLTNKANENKVKEEQESSQKVVEGVDAPFWKHRSKYAMADDRFSFPPVPGYTGYIPRSHEHFAKPYVQTTTEALHNFQHMVLNHRQLPPLIQAIQSERPNVAKIERRANKPGSTEPQHNAFAGLTSPVDDYTPYGSPAGHPRMTFVSGYTGFVPKLQHYFGEPYPQTVRKAIQNFKKSEDPTVPIPEKEEGHIEPIPGFTGFIPCSKYDLGNTFGRTVKTAYEAFDQGADFSSPHPIKQRGKPITGYSGHIRRN